MAGLIAFFDILGYQSFLENNSATEGALKVLDLITQLPKKITEDQRLDWKESKNIDKKSKQVAKHLNHLVFSDTIVLSLPYPSNADEHWKGAAASFLSIVSGSLAARMFEDGLPLRGAIVEGNFVFKDMCLAGRAVVDAYRMCQSLDFSGLVASPHLEHYLRDRFDHSIFGRGFVHYLSPLKDGSEKKLLHVNWVSFFSDKKAFKTDVEQFMLQRFWAHEKDCAIAVDNKIRNSIKLARRLQIADEEWDKELEEKKQKPTSLG